LQIDGQTVDDALHLKRLMSGPPQSVLVLTFARAIGDEYSIRVQRSTRHGDRERTPKEVRRGRWHDVAFLSLPCSQIGLEVDSHWHVQRVVAGSPADLRGGVVVGDRVLRIDDKDCDDQPLSAFSGDAGTSIKIEMKPVDGSPYVVKLVRELSCHIGSSVRCGFPSGTSISLAYLIDKKGAAEMFCVTISVRTSGDEVMMERTGEDQHSLSSGITPPSSLVHREYLDTGTSSFSILLAAASSSTSRKQARPA